MFPNGGKEKMAKSTKNLVIISMLMALSFIGFAIQFTIPMIAPLKFDLSEFFCIIGGLIFGPLVGLLIVAVKVILHYFFFEPEPIGHIMNFIAVGSMVVVSSLIFRPFREKQNKWMWLIIGIVAGVIVRTAIMVPTNFIVLKHWWGSFFPDAVAAQAFVYGTSIPFNLIQGVASGAITLPLFAAFERWHDKH